MSNRLSRILDKLTQNCHAAVTYIDSSAVQAFKDLHEEYKVRHIQVLFMVTLNCCSRTNGTCVEAACQTLRNISLLYIQIAIANPNRQVHLLLSRSGIIDLIGAEWCFVRVHDAVQVCLQHVQSSSPNAVKLAQASKDLADSNPTPNEEQQQRRYGFFMNLWKAQNREGEAGGEVQPLLRQNLV